MNNNNKRSRLRSTEQSVSDLDDLNNKKVKKGNLFDHYKYRETDRKNLCNICAKV
jgi:hypothetical protein